MNPPCPTFSIDIKLPDDGSEADLSALPNRPGVFALENANDETICLAVTANLRRLVRSRLAPMETREEGKRSRRVDYRAAARRVKAVSVASSFEADWAYLQLARTLVPHAAKSLTDRRRSWFVHVNPETEFPRFVKTSTPGKPPTGENGIYLGPINDKHAAARFMDALIAGFDLCRYYHILIEAPNGRACAYKEMGRCPAPCDGSASMAHYRRQIHAAAEFAWRRHAWREACRRRMEKHAEAMEFEAAELCKRQLADLEPAMKPAFDFVDRLDRFQWLATTPAERRGWARLIVISGGWIAPLVDVPLAMEEEQLRVIASAIDQCAGGHAVTMHDADIENIGIVCGHFFRPRSRKSTQPIVFVKIADGCDANQLRSALQTIARRLKGKSGGSTDVNDSDAEEDGDSDVGEQAIDLI